MCRIKLHPLNLDLYSLDQWHRYAVGTVSAYPAAVFDPLGYCVFCPIHVRLISSCCGANTTY